MRRTNSCKNPKQGGGKKSGTTTVERYEDYQPTGEVVSEIEAFVDAADSNTIGNMPLNEAVWKLEAAASFVKRYQMFDYEDYGYHNLEYAVEMNGDNAIGSSINSIYDDLLVDVEQQDGHFLYADLHAEVAEGTAKIYAIVKFAYDKSPWNNRVTSVGERQAGNAKDCSDPANNRYLSGHDLVAERALNKYQNSVGYDPTVYYFWSSIITKNTPEKQLAGNDNGLHHPKGTLYPSDCITQSEMEDYRDLVVGHMNGHSGTALDCGIIWDSYYTGSTNNSGAWRYTPGWQTPSNTLAGIVIANQGLMSDPFGG